MNMVYHLIYVFLVPVLFSENLAEDVHTTKFFKIPIEPNLFNWTVVSKHEYEYHASLLRAPDLPDWMHYVYSKRHLKGFLYGVPPPNQIDFDVEIIGLNRNTYETRRRVIHLIVHKKQSPATHQVHLKIDNRNVDEFFEPYLLPKLLDVFRNKLWTESFADLYVTFMASAVTQGARRPLLPKDSEGVVMRLGSSRPFSNNLIQLQEEVKPLWKMRPCPRDFKRTTVERLFREEGFNLDWCTFELITETQGNFTPAKDVIFPHPSVETEPIWKPLSRPNLPVRSYGGEFAVTILIPMLIMVLLVVLLSGILCFQHEGMDEESEVFFKSLFQICEDYGRSKRKREEPEEKLNQYVAVQRATSTLRSLSRQRDVSPGVLFPPINEDDVTRPNPPPYTGGTLRSCHGEF